MNLIPNPIHPSPFFTQGQNFYLIFVPSSCNVTPNSGFSVKVKVLRIFALLLVWAASFSPCDIRAQIFSPAFDPHCYQPNLSDPSVVDSICGDTAGQQLGLDLTNIGSPPYSPYGSVVFALTVNDRYNNRTDLSLDSPPPIDLHKASYGRRVNFQLPGKITFIGPIHTSTSRDIVIGDVPDLDSNGTRIYWESDSGTYSADAYSYLIMGPKAKFALPLAIGKVVSDTVDDILAYGDTYGPPVGPNGLTEDSLHFMLFRGGSRLYGKQNVVFADSSAVVDTGFNRPLARPLLQGNFTGPLSLFSSDFYGNWFISRVPHPFSFTAFGLAFLQDTLLAARQNRRLLDVSYGGVNAALALSAFSKAIGDSSDDLAIAVTLDSNIAENDYVLFFRGGPEFGTHQITIDSAKFKIRNPQAIDPYFESEGYFGQYMSSCGDLAKNGDNVICIETPNALWSDYFFFYELGQDMDDKADMYFEPLTGYQGSWQGADTITADLSGYESIITANPEWNTDSEAHIQKLSYGSIMIVKGLDKIPAHRNSVEPSVAQATGTIAFSPNPCSGKGILECSEESLSGVEIKVQDIMGRIIKILHEPGRTETLSVPISLTNLPNGVYIITVTTPSTHKAIRVVEER